MEATGVVKEVRQVTTTTTTAAAATNKRSRLKRIKRTNHPTSAVVNTSTTNYC